MPRWPRLSSRSHAARAPDSGSTVSTGTRAGARGHPSGPRLAPQLGSRRRPARHPARAALVAVARAAVRCGSLAKVVGYRPRTRAASTR
ncbi:hypothetical protein Scel_19670 [Streptomyces cellostaticus]|nr:hypothetical protein Scel_19670 [Streptomyces cellostaticus]